MRNLLAFAGMLAMSVVATNCRGKEGPQGPQGPSGADLVRPQQGFIEGIARGRDNSGNAFNIPFRYTYYFSLGTYRSTGTNTWQFDFSRADSLGIGELSFSFQWNQSNNSVSNLTINGTAANITQSPTPTYDVQTLPNIPNVFPGTSQTVSNLALNNDTLTGRFEYIRHSYNNVPSFGTNTHADTVEGTFSIKLVRTQSYNRLGQ